MRSRLLPIFVLIAFLVSPLAFVRPAVAETGDPVINEIHADPASGLPGDANGDGVRDFSDDEFVEIYNDSGGDLDLSGWTISDEVGVRHTFPAGSVVTPGCSVVVFGGDLPTGVFGRSLVQTASTGALGLNNGGDTVTLNDGTTDVVSERYGSDGGDNQSLTREPDITGTFVKHSEAFGSGGALWSPGTMIDGSLFTGCTIPKGVGSADPDLLKAGEATLLTVDVIPGIEPPSTALAVVGDLSAIGGSTTQSFFDDGSNGDVSAGDNVFSFDTTVAAGTTPGTKSLPLSISDNEGRTGYTSISLTVFVDLTIMQIQGAGHLSPLDGGAVRTEGIVTALAFNGFYAQNPLGDGDDATSDGIFVFTGGSPSVVVGDEVEVTGGLSEFISGGAATGNLSTTQISSLLEDVKSSGNPLPAPVVIGTSGRVAPAVDVISDPLPTNLQLVPGVFNPDNDGIDFYESLEGMLVTIEDPVAVSATRTFSFFSSEMFTLTNNGTEIAPSTARTARGGINLQPDPNNDGDQNPERVQIQFDRTLYPEFLVPEITVGDRLGDVTGVVGYSFGNFEVNATQTVVFTPSGLVDETTSLSGEDKVVTVASYNVLNLSPLGEDDSQRATLASQIVNNLGAPDVIALQEIQDNSGETDDGTTDASQTLQALVDAIYAAGGPSYEFFDVAPADGTSGGVPGGNIRNAYLYNPDRIKLVDFVSLTPDVLTDIGVSNPDAFFGTRNPLLATFKFSGKEFSVINNHLSSRFGSTPVFGGPQPFFQAAEDAREAQTGTLNEVVDVLLDGGKGNLNHASKSGRVIVLGDLNTMEFTDDMTEILPGTGADRVLTNLIDLLTDDNVYTFNFEGNSQVLDNFFVTDNLLAGVEFDIVHLNVDFPRVETPVGSDHEPLLAALDIDDHEPKVDFTLTLLHNNDGESKLVNLGTGLEDFGGAARFKTLVDELKAEALTVGGVLMVSSGDNFLAGPEFTASLNDGVWYDAMALDSFGYDAIDLGNHDFDFGPDILAAFIAEGFDQPGTPPYLSANLDFSGEPALQALVEQGVIAASTVVEEGGEHIGIIGATTPNLTFISSPRNVVVDPDVAGAVQDEVDDLEAMGVDKIILISHLQDIDGDIALAAQLTGIDVMVAGGGDELLANRRDLLVPGDADEVFGPYPMIAVGADGHEIPVVTTSGQYGYLGRLTVGFDKKGNLVSVSPISGPVRVAGGDNADAVAPDPQVQDLVTEPVSAFVADLASNVIGTSAVALDGTRSGVRSMETNEGNLIADSLLWQAAQLVGDFGVDPPDVALQNGGGIRNDNIIPAGTISELDTFSMVPFPNFVTVLENIPRSQFKEILENAVSRTQPGDTPGGTGRFAQIAGFSFVYSASGTAQVLNPDGTVATLGTRVQEVVLDSGPVIVFNGAVVPGADLIIATIDFLARGGDEYPFRGAPFTVLGASYQQALSNYIQAPTVDGGLSGLISAGDYPEGGEGRITNLP